ncbi:MAG: hypothetical protein JKY98_07755 [Gammaproteobacteria bacterium]|nr:hypothetical protein [Gammaproteobacteria bacterium]
MTSVSRRFTIAIGALVILSMCIFWLISHYNTQNLMRQQADTLGQTLAQQTATAVTELVLANDLISMNVMLGQLTRGAAISEAAVLNVDGEVIAISSTLVNPPRSLLPVQISYGEYFAPISLPNANAGNVRIQLDISYIEVGVSNNLLFIAAATLLLLVVAISLSITYFQYLVSFPIRLLNYALQGIRIGEIETCPEPETNNEISRLIRQYNSTAEFLTKYTFINNLVSAEDNPGSQEPAFETFNTAVLCIRLTNFHYLASTHDKNSMVTLLNRFYFLAENVTGLYNGSISYCADGEIIISFNKDQLEDEQCFYAVCAGQLFLKLLGIVVDIADLPEPIDGKFRLAVHFGESTPGLYSPMSREYNNVTGLTLDLTRQICDECPDNSLLVSETAFHHAGGDSRIAGEEFGVADEDYRLSTYLCSNAMSSYKPLLEKQAERLTELMKPG